MPATASSVTRPRSTPPSILRRLVEVDVLIDMVHPPHRNEVVFPSGASLFVSLILSVPSRWSTLPIFVHPRQSRPYVP